MRSATERWLSFVGRAVSVALVGASCGPAEPAAAPSAAASPLAHFFGSPPAGLAEDLSPSAYRLELEVDPAAERYAGTVEIDLKSTGINRNVVWLHARRLSVRRAAVRTRSGWSDAEFEQKGGMVQLLLHEVPSGTFSIRIRFDAPFAEGERGFMRAEGGGEHYTASSLEPTFARDVFPCFDEPRFRAPFRVALVVPEGDVAVSNTPVESSTPLPNRRKRVVFVSTPPLPTYLVAFAVGPYDVVPGPTVAPSELRPRPVPLRALLPRSSKPHALDDALRVAADVLPDLERYTAIGYPFGKLDVIAVPRATHGMENPGAIVMPGWWATVAPGERSAEWRHEMASWVAHELAHMWFGDLVTLSAWEHLWIKEGAATWLAARVLDARYPDEGFAAERVDHQHRAMVVDEGRTRMLRAALPADRWLEAYDAVTYDKGAAVLGSFERWLSPEKFRDGMRDYLAGHRFGAASSDDLVKALSRHAGPDFAPAMWTFVMQAGVPLVEAGVECEGARHELVVHQLLWHHFREEGVPDTTWRIPMCARYRVGGRTRESCGLVATKNDRLVLEGDACPAWVHPNADAAGYYRWTLPEDDMDKLAQNRQALSIAERLSVEANLHAALRRGTMTVTGALRLLERFASDPDLRVAAASLPALSWIHHRYAAEPALAAAIEQYARRVYAAAKARASWAPPDVAAGPSQIQRAALLEFLAKDARDGDVRAEALRRGRAYLGMDGDRKLHTEVAPWDLAALALTTAVEDGGEAVIDAVIGNLSATRDELVRARLLLAAGATRRPEALARLRSLALGRELTSDEVLRLLVGQIERDDATRDDTLRWIDEHLDELGARLSVQRTASLGGYARLACDEEHAAAVDERLRGLRPADPRRQYLPAAADAIRACAFLRKRHEDEARAFFLKPR